MKRDPYRELAEKHRKELKLQEWTEIEEEPKTLSRTEYRKQKKQEKNLFYASYTSHSIYFSPGGDFI